MNILQWTYVCDDPLLQDGHMIPVYPLGVNVILARVEGVVYALSGKCIHMACPLFTGTLKGYIIICPCHDWQFDIRTGKFIDAPELGIAVYPVKNDHGKLFVNIT